MSEKLFRIAPTPSGFLHEGNLFHFLWVQLLAKKNAAGILLRIDDMDADRMRPEYLSDIFRWIEKLKIDVSKGPSGPDDFMRNWSQRGRMDLYNKLLNDLEKIDALFGCECSRSEIAANQTGKAYPGTCEVKNIPLHSANIAWRLKVDKNCVVEVNDMRGTISVRSGEETGSFVVRRRDGLPAYHVCSVADDLHFGVTHVIRGADLLESTAAQLHLASVAGRNELEAVTWYHHKLLLDARGMKISKSTLHSGEPLNISAAGVRQLFEKQLRAGMFE